MIKEEMFDRFVTEVDSYVGCLRLMADAEKIIQRQAKLFYKRNSFVCEYLDLKSDDLVKAYRKWNKKYRIHDSK